MINATQIRPGMIIVYEGDLYRVSSVNHLTPGNKRGFMQTKMKNLKTGVGTERKFRSEDRLEQAMLETRMMQYLYHEGDLHTFMDTENYEQTSLAAEEIGDLLFYLLPDQVVETEPSLKGATASSSYKPAKLETGITIQVPPFVQVRDRVRVDPSEGKYLERIK